MKVARIEPISTMDWIGHVSSVVFMVGCNLSCPFCHNSELINEYSNIGRDMTPEEMVEEILQNRRVIDSVVFTGGEPVVAFVAREMDRLINPLKEAGLKLMLNTNGSMYFGTTWHVPRFDAVAMDIKAPTQRPELYKRMCGSWEDGVRVANSLMEMQDQRYTRGLEVEIRTTIVPGMMDKKRWIREIAMRWQGKVDRYVLQQFVPSEHVLDPKLRDIKSPTREEMLILGKEARLYIPETYIRTLERGLEKVELS